METLTLKENVGWLQGFKSRHGIVCRTVCEESGSTDTDIEHHWKNNKLPKLIKGFNPCDIFNADKTGLFHKLMPEKTLQLKGEKGRRTGLIC